MALQPSTEYRIQDTQTAIIGNGLIGALTQLIFQHNGWPYICFGQTPQNIKKKLLLNAHSIEFLKALNINPPIKSQHHRLKISAYHHRAKIIYDESDPLCYGVDSVDLLNHILQHLPPTSSEVNSITRENDQYHLSTQEGIYRTQYLVGCDGNQSISRQAAQIDTVYRSTQYYTIIPGHIEGNTLVQHHQKNMTLAVLPGQDGMIIITSSTPISLQSISLSSLQQRLKHHCQIRKIKSPITLQNQPCMAKKCYQHHCLVLGNAALSIEPVAAQGFNHALKNLKLLYNLPQFNNTYLSEVSITMNYSNTQLFNNMIFIHSQTLKNRFIKSALLHMNMLTPIIKQQLMYFGNRYD